MQVAIQLHTEIDDAGEIEKSNVKASGEYHQKNNLNVITYKEKIEEQGEINNLITIQSEKISIKRFGFVSMHQQFRKGQITENVYQHPHGNIHMETFTKDISFEPPKHGQSGRLRLNYTVKLNGQNERKHTLELLFTEEDAQ